MAWILDKLGRRTVIMLLSMGLLTGLGACQGNAPPNPTPPATSISLNGAGASFPAILYLRWFEEYHRQNPDVQINYQAIGSAAGIQQMLSETIDFGASDVAMTDAEMAQVKRGVLLLPMTGGSVAIAYNLPGVESGLQLSRQALAQIFLGQLTRWNDPRIAQLNPGVKLPSLPITLVYRSDGSGTTATLTAHLSAISPEWKKQVGTGLNVSWPAGIGIKANAGVSAQIQQAEGAIGYVEYGYAQELKLPLAALENKAGQYVLPTIEATRKALETVQLGPDLRGFTPDPDGAESYPIVTYSWLLLYQQYPDAAIPKALKPLLEWSLTEGQTMSADLGYVPLPPAVVQQVNQRLQTLAK
jgi:phosphate transport system substrate-binding protein